MGDWTAEAEPAVLLCQKWAGVTQTTLQLQLYLFGSAIYKGGEQFDRETSDIDIVAVLTPHLDAAERAEAIEKLRARKLQLELETIPTLKRLNCNESAVSLVPITSLEVRANVHKSGARRFFDKNFFLDLLSGNERLGLPDAGLVTLPDENRAALEYVQRVRNEYLGQAANLAGGLALFSGADPMPKALLRFAAQLDPTAENGEWYDTRKGLELLFDRLRDRRTEVAFRDLFKRVSVRRGGRGAHEPLSSMDQLLLAELLYDVASKVQTDDVVLWEIRIAGSAFSQDDINRLVAAMRAAAPDASLISVRLGSVILRFQSSRTRFQQLEMLLKRGVLAALLQTKKPELHLMDDSRGQVIPETKFPAHDREWRLRDVISRWKPEFEREIDGARQLMDLLNNATQDGSLPGARIVLDPAIRLARGIVRPDIGVFWQDKERKEMVGVELISLGPTVRFFSVLERMLEMPFQVILVVVGAEVRLSRIRDDVERLERLGGNVRVVTIISDNPSRG